MKVRLILAFDIRSDCIPTAVVFAVVFVLFGTFFPLLFILLLFAISRIEANDGRELTI